MILKYIFFFIIINFNSSVIAKDHYKIEEIKNSKYIGEVYYIEKPVVYIKKLSKCNNSTKNIALNTSCLFIDKSEFKIEEIAHNCTGCLSKKTMTTPLRVELKEKTTLTVIGVFSSSINYLSYKIFGSKSRKHFLLIDQDGNYIEIPFYIIDSNYGIMDNDRSRDSGKIMAIKKLPHIAKKICYYEKSHDNFEDSKNKIIKMLSDFELSDSIKISNSTCNRRGMKKNGVVLTTKNFNDFLTFYYFKGEWGVYGKMD
jgi:hypothetical protein